MLGLCNDLEPRGVKKNKEKVTESIGDHSLGPWMILKGEVISIEMFHLMHLTNRKVGLKIQVHQRPLVSENTNRFTMKVWTPLPDRKNNSKKFTLMCSILSSCASGIFAVVCSQLQAFAKYLLGDISFMLLGGICLNDKMDEHIWQDTNRSSTQGFF